MKKSSINTTFFLVLFLSLAGMHFMITADSVPRLTDGIRIVKYPGGNAAFKFVTAGEVVVVADPFQMNETINPDMVTISHDHGDHNDLSHISGSYKLIDKPGTVSYKGITVTGVAGKHNKGDAGITNIIFVYDFNGIKLAHFASQGEVPDENMYKQIGNVDILLIQCINISSKLSADEVIGIARRLKAKIVIPEHGNPGLLEKHLDFFGGGRIVVPTGTMTVQKADLDKIKKPQLVFLDS